MSSSGHMDWCLRQVVPVHYRENDFWRCKQEVGRNGEKVFRYISVFFFFSIFLHKEIGNQPGRILISLYMVIRCEFPLCYFSEIFYVFKN